MSLITHLPGFLLSLLNTEDMQCMVAIQLREEMGKQLEMKEKTSPPMTKEREEEKGNVRAQNCGCKEDV